jgi:hypothetical protein
MQQQHVKLMLALGLVARLAPAADIPDKLAIFWR